MSNQQIALRLALEALEKNTKHLPVHFDFHFEAIAAIKEALAQPERCKYPNCDYPCMNLPDCQMQGEPTVNTFNPNYDGVAWMYEEMKAMAHELEELKAQPEHEPDRFCDANCTWSDHHPDCKYGTQNSDELTVAYMSGLYDGKKQTKPEQEPVAWIDADGNISDNNDHKCFPIPLYTTPPQRTWVGLTEEEIDDIYWQLQSRIEHQGLIWPYERAIEAKLREKNQEWTSDYVRDNLHKLKPAEQEQPNIKSYPGKDNSQPMKLSDYEPDGMHHNKPIRRTHEPSF